MKRVFTFLLLWLGWGFTLGTVLLLGPLRWVVDYGRNNSWAESSEKSTVYISIALLLFVSVTLAYFSFEMIFQPKTSKGFKGALLAVPLLGFAVSLFVFLNPNWINGSVAHKEEKINAKFGVGPYPELVKMYELKSRGYTSIVSLLHPAVVPFEPSLLEREKENARIAGIELIHIPLLPWISDNKASIDSLRSLVKTGSGKYYMHCYLGKDRANAAARIVKQENCEMEDFGLQKNENRLLDKEFERGPVVELEKDVYLAPLPTKEEYFDVVVDFQQVVSLSDFSNTDAKKRNKEEEQWLQPYNIAFKAFNVNPGTTKSKMLEVVKTVKQLPKPLFIHGFFVDDKELQLFKSVYANAKG